MKRDLYNSSIQDFVTRDVESILGQLTKDYDFDLVQAQRNAWIEEIDILKKVLQEFSGWIFFEYAIPRMGKRIDVILIINGVMFILEFKVGETEFISSSLDQVWDYSLDLKNFHETSHNLNIIPVLIATKAKEVPFTLATTVHSDQLFFPVKANPKMLRSIITSAIRYCAGESINIKEWILGKYQPTPTIIEAAMALYNGHSVIEISRSDAGAKNLTDTTNAVASIIRKSKDFSQKSICFITGVPGAGKTLVGLNITTENNNKKNGFSSVFLSGNGPLVDILREALARDKVQRARERENNKKVKIGDTRREVRAFIQNVHHYRDEYLIDHDAPIDHIAVFDEAQRAWNLEQTRNFMRRKRHFLDFNQSEPQFLISCLNRHKDWAVIICLVGGGQEINTGEAGISEWIYALRDSYKDWNIYISDRLNDSEYGAAKIIYEIDKELKVSFIQDLHLSTSMRSFRNENVSLLIKQILDLNSEDAKVTLSSLSNDYPIVITRDIHKAKYWLKQQARGSERFGIVASSQAFRLKPYAVDVKTTIDPIHWFLDSKDDVRSSYYLEDVATEFQIQGLELDWTGVIWDGDFRYSQYGWKNYSFCGKKWNQIKKTERQNYLKNAYRVLLTRARQGMVIVVPPGDNEDPTRKPEFYDSTFHYLTSIGLPII